MIAQSKNGEITGLKNLSKASLERLAKTMVGTAYKREKIVCCFCGETIRENEKMISVSLFMEIKTEAEPVEQFLFCHFTCIKEKLHSSVPFYLEALVDD